jgi:hypothetical protein
MKDSQDIAYKITRVMYINEPCRICGKLINEDLDEVVFIGYSFGNQSRLGHGKCWKQKKPKKKWAYPVDAKD